MRFGSNTHALMAEDGYLLPGPLGQLLTAIDTLVNEYSVDAVELSLDEMFQYPEMIDPVVFKKIADTQQKHGIAMTVHLPFVWVDLASALELTRAASVQMLANTIELCAPLEIISFVVHATGIGADGFGPHVKDPNAVRRGQIVMESIDRSLGELKSLAPDAPLAVENLPGILYEWQAPMVTKYDLGVCCDIGHLLLQLRDPIPFIEEWMPRLLQLHIHGVREKFFSASMRQRLDHQALGGPDELVDVEGILRVLNDGGCSAPLILENFSRNDLHVSLETLRCNAARAKSVSALPVG